MEKTIKVKDLIHNLEKLDRESRVLLASDEEQNTLFSDIRIEVYEDEIVLFGCSGSEVE